MCLVRQDSHSSHLDLKMNLTTTSRATESNFGGVRCYNLLILYAVNKKQKKPVITPFSYMTSSD